MSARAARSAPAGLAQRARWLAVAFALALALPTPLAAQAAGNKEDDEIAKLGRNDPYTDGDAARMAAAGIVAYGPLPWADFKTTDDVDRVLGEHRMLWLETAHLRIGCSLKTIALPTDQQKRRALLAETSAMHARLPDVPEKPKKLDPWLRAHLFAQRAEATYAAFQQLLGVTDADFPRSGANPGQGPFLGQQDKYLLLLFHKQADLARYFEAFCDLHKDEPSRFHHTKSWQLVAAICCEGFEDFDDAALHRYVVYMLMHNFSNGYRGFFYALPLWLDEGLAHWYSHQIESDFVTFRQKPGEAINRDKQHLWPQKVRQRLEHQEMLIPFATVTGWASWEDLGFQDHMQAWSRVDYLMRRGPGELGIFVKQLKNLPPPQGQPVTKASVDARQAQLLMQLWQLDGESFDRLWREWVLKTYPKK